MTRARLYYEAHLTIEAKDPSHWEDLKRALPGWKVSRFDVDEVDDYTGQWFASARGADRHNLAKDILAALTRLEQFSFTTLRWKIEDTVLDSKHGDTEDALRQL